MSLERTIPPTEFWCQAREFRAAAMTYVTGVASSAGYLVYLLMIAGQSLLKRPKPPLPPKV